MRTLADGSTVRVNGSIDQDRLEELAAKVRAHVDSRCHDVGPHEMPQIAQSIHGRRTYWCDEDRGHEGPHRWAGFEWTADE
ncbi:hypothetical protein [Ornithinimicrobium cerasi]|uniref:hypothetical protein n=1 Tax=Ornithinimicrobium cerasi TaxID=2248773 RepID=UPI001379A0FF|nr:hypothetical protein [Ornithinimicrobium cerasi]